jgi:hypothetical protein
MEPPRLMLLVRLFIRPGREIEFREFETQAARIMGDYQGRIEYAIRPTASPPPAELPHEIHVVSFPGIAQFEAYRRDPRLIQLASLRESAIARTEVTSGEERQSYLPD